MNNILYLHEISFSVVQNFVLFLLIRFHGFLFLTEVERESYHKIKRVYIYFDSDFSVVVRQFKKISTAIYCFILLY